MERRRSDALGRIHIDVIFRAWTSPFTTKSDYARTHATHVATAASSGFITTELNTNIHSNLWVVTQKGLEYLNEQRN